MPTPGGDAAADTPDGHVDHASDRVGPVPFDLENVELVLDPRHPLPGPANQFRPPERAVLARLDVMVYGAVPLPSARVQRDDFAVAFLERLEDPSVNARIDVWEEVIPDHLAASHRFSRSRPARRIFVSRGTDLSNWRDLCTNWDLHRGRVPRRFLTSARLVADHLARAFRTETPSAAVRHLPPIIATGHSLGAVEAAVLGGALGARIFGVDNPGLGIMPQAIPQVLEIIMPVLTTARVYLPPATTFTNVNDRRLELFIARPNAVNFLGMIALGGTSSTLLAAVGMRRIALGDLLALLFVLMALWSVHMGRVSAQSRSLRRGLRWTFGILIIVFCGIVMWETFRRHSAAAVADYLWQLPDLELHNAPPPAIGGIVVLVSVFLFLLNLPTYLRHWGLILFTILAVIVCAVLEYGFEFLE
jgi:hypothetical protein